MKLLAKIVAVVVILVVIAAVAAWIWIDSIAKAGIEKGGTATLGVNTTVDDVSLSLLKGQLVMDGLRIANPEGFSSPHLMQSGRFDVQVETGSVFSDTIVLPKFELDGMDINIEKNDKGNNVSTVLDNIKSKAPEEEAKKPEEGGKKVKLDRVVVRNIAVHLHLPIIGGGDEGRTLKVPEIVLEDVSSDDSAGVVVGQLTGKLFAAIMAAVVEKVGSDLPAALAGTLKTDIAAAASAIRANQLVGQVGGAFESLAGKTAEGLKEQTGKLGDAASKAVEGLGGLLGGKKEEEK